MSSERRKSATSRHAQRVGQRNRTSGRGSGRTTKSSRATRTRRGYITEYGLDENDVMFADDTPAKMTYNRRTGKSTARPVRDRGSEKIAARQGFGWSASGKRHATKPRSKQAKKSAIDFGNR